MPDRVALARAEQRRVLEQPGPREQAEDRAGQQDGGQHRQDHADAEREGEALDAGGRDHEEHERDQERDHVAVDDRAQALAVALLDRALDGSARLELVLEAFEDDDVGVGGDRDREDQAGDARQRHHDRDDLDDREEEDRVREQADHRDQAEHAVEEQQEDRDDEEARDARDQPLVEGLLTERRRDLLLGDDRQLERQRAGLEQVGERLRALLREAAGAADLRARVAADPLGVGLEVDVGRRDQVVVERDREVVGAALHPHLLRLALLEDAVVGAALGDVAGDALPDLLAPVAELEDDDRVAARPGRVDARRGVLDVLAAQGRAIADQEVLVADGDRFAVGVDLLLGAQHAVALGHHDDFDVVGPRLPVGAEVPRHPLVLLEALDVVVRSAEDLLRLVVDQVVLVADERRELLVDVRLQLGAAHHRVVLRDRPRAAGVGGRRAAGHRGVGRHGLTVRADDVGLPVVEGQLRRGADAVAGLVRVVDRRQRDVDLIGARALDLRFADAVLVDAVLHHVDRALDRVVRQLLAARRTDLVDQLHPALEV